jgi:hypothetical protein
MTTSTSYAASRAARVEMLRLRRRAARIEGLFRALVLAGALTMLVMCLNGAVRDGAHKVATALETTSVR